MVRGNGFRTTHKLHNPDIFTRHRQVRRIRQNKVAGEITGNTAYYLLSTALSAERFNEVVRSHRGIENRPHWRLDVVMNEDQARDRMDNGPCNLAIPRHMAMNIMQKDTFKGSLRGKLKRAGWDATCPRRCLAGFGSAIALGRAFIPTVTISERVRRVTCPPPRRLAPPGI